VEQGYIKDEVPDVFPRLVRSTFGLSLETEPLGTWHYPLQRKLQCRGHLNQLDIKKSTGPSRVHPSMVPGEDAG